MTSLSSSTFFPLTEVIFHCDKKYDAALLVKILFNKLIAKQNLVCDRLKNGLPAINVNFGWLRGFFNGCSNKVLNGLFKAASKFLIYEPRKVQVDYGRWVTECWVHINIDAFVELGLDFCDFNKLFCEPSSQEGTHNTYDISVTSNIYNNNQDLEESDRQKNENPLPEQVKEEKTETKKKEFGLDDEKRKECPRKWQISQGKITRCSKASLASSSSNFGQIDEQSGKADLEGRYSAARAIAERENPVSERDRERRIDNYWQVKKFIPGDVRISAEFKDYLAQFDPSWFRQNVLQSRVWDGCKNVIGLIRQQVKIVQHQEIIKEKKLQALKLEASEPLFSYLDWLNTRNSRHLSEDKDFQSQYS